MSSLFRSFWMGGFESACHINFAGQRLDMICATQHDTSASDDYARLRTLGIGSGHARHGEEQENGGKQRAHGGSVGEKPRDPTGQGAPAEGKPGRTAEACAVSLPRKYGHNRPMPDRLQVHPLNPQSRLIEKAVPA